MNWIRNVISHPKFFLWVVLVGDAIAWAIIILVGMYGIW